ncbi:MAG: DUF721 domain-containing protein [Planctomycetaceae bacterium]|nr:DUF721 domain-containing protein [Planctomycetaceae bacterium]
MDDSQLRTVWQQRQKQDRAVALAVPLATLMKRTLSRRYSQFGALAKLWDEMIPQSIAAHTALESFSRGVLTVMVDSAAHRFQLQTLLSGGVTKAIQSRFGGALNKIRLIPGQFFSLDEAGQQRYQF